MWFSPSWGTYVIINHSAFEPGKLFRTKECVQVVGIPEDAVEIDLPTLGRKE
jgi:hypothetical protein